MVEISMSGSGEGPVWVTGRGYSTTTWIGGLGSMASKLGRKRGTTRGYGCLRHLFNPCQSGRVKGFEEIYAPHGAGWHGFHNADRR